MMENITRYLTGVKVGEPLTFKNLTVFPLVAPSASALKYITLDEAIAAETVSIMEVSDAGSVPVIRFVNKGDQPVLIFDGEELVGAKQNRVVNLTILAPANKTLDIPVSCVEAGRWNYSSSEFSSAKHAVYANLRARKVDQVSCNLEVSGSRSADQSDIWVNIAAKSHRMRAESPTAAMAQIYESHGATLDSFTENLRSTTGQCGVVFAIRGRTAGFDLFDNPATLQKLYPKLISSYALDALDSHDGAFEAPGMREAERLIAEIAERTDMKSFPAIGEGMDVRITGRQITGAALIADECPVHICAFYRETGDQIGRDSDRSARTGFTRASHRLRHRENRG